MGCVYTETNKMTMFLFSSNPGIMIAFKSRRRERRKDLKRA